MRAATRLLALAAALGAGWFLFGAGPRDVTLVYDLGAPGARALEVRIARDGSVLRRAEFRLAPERPPRVQHEVKLPEGTYLLAWRVDEGASAPARTGERSIVVEDDGTIVVPLGR